MSSGSPEQRPRPRPVLLVRDEVAGRRDRPSRASRYFVPKTPLAPRPASWIEDDAVALFVVDAAPFFAGESSSDESSSASAHRDLP